MPKGRPSWWWWTTVGRRLGRCRAPSGSPTSRWWSRERNLGYGAAANRGVAATTAPSVLVCNSDLEVRPGSAGRPGRRPSTAEPRCALVGPLIRNPEGERYPSARRFPSLIDAAGHALLGIFAPDNRFTRSYQQAELRIRGD